MDTLKVSTVDLTLRFVKCTCVVSSLKASDFLKRGDKLAVTFKRSQEIGANDA
jgi:hypothetical protein